MANTINVNARDWATQDTSWVIPDGQIFWFDGDPELGADTKFNVIGDGATTVAELDRFVPKGVDDGTTFLLRSSNVNFGCPNPMCSAYPQDDDTIRIMLNMGTLAKQDASSISYAGDSDSNIEFTQGIITTGTVDFSSATFSDVQVDGNLVFFRATVTDAFVDLTTYKGCFVVGLSKGGTFTLS